MTIKKEEWEDEKEFDITATYNTQVMARTYEDAVAFVEDQLANDKSILQYFNVESNPLRNELKEFVECLIDKRTPFTDVNNAVDVAKNLDLLFKSLT